MTELYLVRHAVAFGRDAARWPDDRDRPLSHRGERRFRSAARGLGSLVPGVDVLLSSSFSRAWRTAELLGEEAGWAAPKASIALEANRTPRHVLTEIQHHLPVSSLALVGHEPGLSRLASLMLTGGDQLLALDLRKGSVIQLRFDGAPIQGKARLGWFLSPKALRALDH